MKEDSDDSYNLEDDAETSEDLVREILFGETEPDFGEAYIWGQENGET